MVPHTLLPPPPGSTKRRRLFSCRDRLDGALPPLSRHKIAALSASVSMLTYLVSALRHEDGGGGQQHGQRQQARVAQHGGPQIHSRFASWTHNARREQQWLSECPWGSCLSRSCRRRPGSHSFYQWGALSGGGLQGMSRADCAAISIEISEDPASSEGRKGNDDDEEEE